jgi:hypothetical protein
MDLGRWQQINRYFHVFDIQTTAEHLNKPKIRPFNKIDTISATLRQRWKHYYSPGRDLAINECMQRFTDRVSEIVNIPGKPTPIGFKI